MKLNKYIHLLLLLLVVIIPIGCMDAETQMAELNGAEGEKVQMRIGITLPENQQVDARSFISDNFVFNHLYVAVFEKKGEAYIYKELVPVSERHDNQDKIQWNGESQCWEFGIELTKTDAQCRLHLIANYPDLTMSMGEEGNLIGRMPTDEDISEHDVYWNYIEVQNITEEQSSLLIKVPLVRNFTKIKVDLSDELSSKFQLTGYAVHNVPNRGTVAPFNVANGSFANYCLTEGASVKSQTYQNLKNEQGYLGNEPYGNTYTRLTNQSEFINPATAFYMYERTHEGSDNPTSIIVKGKYNPDGTGNFDGIEDTYYKLDFIYRDSNTNTNVYYNLLRNFEYTVKVVSIIGEGYRTPEEAISMPASNNISGSTNVSNLTNISDGTGRLYVSTTYQVFTDENSVDIYYKYIPDINEPITINNNLKNNGGEIIVTAPAGDVLRSSAVVESKDETSDRVGWRKITLTPYAPGDIVKTQEIYIASGNLQRKIMLVLRRPYEMVIDILNDNDLVNKVQQSPVNVKVSIPGGIPMSLFPLKFYLKSADNTIYAKPGTDMYSEVFVGSYGFVKEISWNFYNSANAGGNGIAVAKKETDGKISFICEFLTNTAESATTITVENEYFNTQNCSFTNPD